MDCLLQEETNISSRPEVNAEMDKESGLIINIVRKTQVVVNFLAKDPSERQNEVSEILNGSKNKSSLVSKIYKKLFSKNFHEIAIASFTPAKNMASRLHKFYKIFVFILKNKNTKSKQYILSRKMGTSKVCDGKAIKRQSRRKF